MNTKSLSGAEYFLTFIDDKTRHVWVYILKRKDEIFERFLEWKAQVEKNTRRKLKALRTDNGGEYISTDFKAYLRTEGVRHELTVPKTPKLNGVAERMNQTLVETVRAMLADTKLHCTSQVLGRNSIHSCLSMKPQPKQSSQRNDAAQAKQSKE